MSISVAQARRLDPELFFHARRAARSALYLLLGLPLGLLYLAALTVTGATGPGPLRWALSIERTFMNALLAARLPPIPEQLSRRLIATAALRLPLALLGLASAAAPAVLAVFVAVEAILSLNAGGDRYLGPLALDQPGSAAALLVIVPATIVCVAALEESGSVARRLAREALAAAAVFGAVRDALAESLGDRTLTIAYWLPERSVFVDEHGRRVELPEPRSGRAWTAVEHGGRRVAAIIHAAELEARPELVQAAASGAVLALENEQLKADLRARLEELRLSRRRIVEASNDARRRIERDLHDGAQQQLVALALDVQLLKTRVENPETRALVDAAAEKLAAAIAELRELARGIHPGVLTARGLAPALASLAERAPVPVELDLSLQGRAPAGVEAAAYFLCAEALTNVARHANAKQARVTLRQTADALGVEIADDGVGGAALSRGSGLRGLEDRIAAVGGELTLDSPPGGGTRVRALIPLGEEGT